METKKILKTCDKGHKFYKSSDCPTCPVCEEERKPMDNFLSLISAPARRALENNGILTLEKLSEYSEKEILKFHGMGKSSIPKLEKLLSENGLTFKNQKSDNEMEQNKCENKTMPTPFAQTYFHGTKADLKPGDYIQVGNNSNYGERKNAKYIFLTATLDAAIWGAELANGDGRERIYLAEPTGEIEDDPDLTDKKFPGNPTKSYRSTKPFRVVGEVTIWQGHPAEQVKAMKDALEKLKIKGINSLND